MERVRAEPWEFGQLNSQPAIAGDSRRSIMRIAQTICCRLLTQASLIQFGLSWGYGAVRLHPRLLSCRPRSRAETQSQFREKIWVMTRCNPGNRPITFQARRGDGNSYFETLSVAPLGLDDFGDHTPRISSIGIYICFCAGGAVDISRW